MSDIARSVPDRLSQAEPELSAVPASIPSAKTIAFTGENGDRFIFPSWIVYSDDPDAPSLSDLWWQANAICSRVTGLKQDQIAFDPKRFPHVIGSIGSNIFLHGSATVLFFAGPEFDDAVKAIEAEGGSPDA